MRSATGRRLAGIGDGNPKAWRDVVTPHPDVAGGPVPAGGICRRPVAGPPGGRPPANTAIRWNFFRRTYLTESLQRPPWWERCNRLTGGGGRLRWYSSRPTLAAARPTPCWPCTHLFSRPGTREPLGIDVAMKEAGRTTLPPVRRVVPVGNKISPAAPLSKKMEQ